MTTFYKTQDTPVTATLTLDSLASGSARQSTVIDLGANHAAEMLVRLRTKWASAPTSGTLLRLFAAWCETNSNYPGGCSGSDAAFSDVDDLRNLDELKPLVADADTDSQVVSCCVRVQARYLILVVYNDATGKALSGTGSDHALTVTPHSDAGA